MRLLLKKIIRYWNKITFFGSLIYTKDLVERYPTIEYITKYGYDGSAADKLFYVKYDGSFFEISLTPHGVEIVNFLKIDLSRIITIPATVSNVIVTKISTRFEPYLNDVKIAQINLQDGFICIGDVAFKNLRNLKNINIPNSVTAIGESAFANCESLKSIILPNKLTQISDWAFAGCNSLKSIIIPSSVTTIGKGAFDDCSSLNTIEIPNSVTIIHEGAFNNCISLRNIVIPSSVTKIGKHAFNHCSKLKNIKIEAQKPPILDETPYPCWTKINISVPVTSIDVYKNDLIWSKYKSQIIGY